MSHNKSEKYKERIYGIKESNLLKHVINDINKATTHSFTKAGSNQIKITIDQPAADIEYTIDIEFFKKLKKQLKGAN